MRSFLLLALAAAISTVQGDHSAEAGENAPARLTKPGVVLTFDDTFVEQWLAALPIFAAHHARATFFVSQFDRLSARQMAGLRELAAAGHAIGCHGLRHLKAVDGVQTSSVQAYLAREIEPAVARMHQAGFRPSCFAYPSSQRNEETDAALARHFRHLRSGIGLAPDRTMAQTDAIFTPLDAVSARRCLIGTGLDGAGPQATNGRTLTAIFAAMERAARRREIVVFYAHNISDEGPGHHVSPAVLEKILSYAASAGLAFYTYDDLP